MYCLHITISMKLGNKLYFRTYTFKKKEVKMNVTRTFLHEGKTLQEMMEILLPIYIQEKICDVNKEELKCDKQRIQK